MHILLFLLSQREDWYVVAWWNFYCFYYLNAKIGMLLLGGTFPVSIISTRRLVRCCLIEQLVVNSVAPWPNVAVVSSKVAIRSLTFVGLTLQWVRDLIMFYGVFGTSVEHYQYSDRHLTYFQYECNRIRNQLTYTDYCWCCCRCCLLLSVLSHIWRL